MNELVMCYVTYLVCLLLEGVDRSPHLDKFSLVHNKTYACSPKKFVFIITVRKYYYNFHETLDGFGFLTNQNENIVKRVKLGTEILY